MPTEIELMTIPDMTDLEWRFWSKVEIIKDEDSCWPWKRCRHPEEGRGMFQWTNPDSGKYRVEGAPRVAFYLVNSYLPTCVCHSCDNPPCCRPSHLFAGDWIVNNGDRHRKGRSRGTPQIGELNHFTRFSNANVLQIRELADAGYTHQILANTYGVKRETI